MNSYRWTAPLLFLFSGCALPGCASTPKPEVTGANAAGADVTRDLPDLPPPQSASMAKSKTPKLASSDELLVKRAEGGWAIRRAALQRIQKKGAQSFIRQLEVRPAFHRGRFVGWRVLAYGGPGTLQHGDVVTRVNGASIERPGQFMKVWEEMAEQSHLTIRLMRGQRELRPRWPIVE
ncbi:MAG: hypothetical protein JRH20_00725 [Deltaproteobacteria bacterium]|nr:hypothetical protein [Deltaproteobacteria bacterium]